MLLECLGCMVQFLLNQSMEPLFHERSVTASVMQAYHHRAACPSACYERKTLQENIRAAPMSH